MPIQSSSGLIIPDFNRMAQCQQDLHQILVDMICSQGRVQYSTPTASRHAYDEPTGQFQFVLEQSSSAGTPVGSIQSLIFASSRATGDFVLGSSCQKPDDHWYLSLNRPAVTDIECILKTYQSQAGAVKTFRQAGASVPDFKTIAADQEILHGLLCDMIQEKASRVTLSLFQYAYVYKNAALGLLLDMTVTPANPVKGLLHEEGIQIFNVANGPDSVFYSKYVEPAFYGCGGKVGVWPPVQAELKAALPAIQARRALSRSFP